MTRKPTIWWLTFLGLMLWPGHIFAQEPSYRLFRDVDIPPTILTEDRDMIFGGDIRIGDFENNNQLSFLIYRGAQLVEGGASHPVFIAVFRENGEILWQRGSGGTQPNRPGPVAVHDIDGDQETEIIALFLDQPLNSDPFSLQNVHLLILNGHTGEIEREKTFDELQQITGRGPNWVHQRILIANLSGQKIPGEFIVKLGKHVFAINHELKILWSYYNPNDEYQNCPAYIPAVGDVDKDGRDEINGGYYLLDDDGKVLWERKLGKNMDCVLIEFWDSDSTKRAICSGGGFVMDHRGDTVLMIGEQLIPHGQELRVGNFAQEYPGREMFVRYDGHKPAVHLISKEGSLIRSFELNSSPNNTGMEEIQWYGQDTISVLYNGGMIWNAQGERIAEFRELRTLLSAQKGRAGITQYPWTSVVMMERKSLFTIHGTQPSTFSPLIALAGLRQSHTSLAPGSIMQD